MHPTTWKASGHVDALDPLIDNKDSKEDIEPMF
jgi:glycyl-tRNA synthetase